MLSQIRESFARSTTFVEDALGVLALASLFVACLYLPAMF